MIDKTKTSLVSFHVGDKNFTSDVSALQYFTKNLTQDLRMDFNFSLGDDWSTEPEQELEYYRQQMCAYIENTYHNITVAYSGGTDSETIIDAFKRRGTRQLTLLHLTNSVSAETEARQRLEQEMKERIQYKHADAIKNLGWKFRIGTRWEVGSSDQTERSITDGKFTAWNPDVDFLNQWFEDKPTSGIVPRYDQKRAGCVVYGKEKPEIGIENGWWVARYMSSMFETPFSFSDEVDDVYFFIDGACTDLPKKISWLKARAMEKIFLRDNILPTEKNANDASLFSSPYYREINRATGFQALSDFLNTDASKIWGWWRQKLEANIKTVHKETNNKSILIGKYFDEVLVKTIDNRFLDLKHRMVDGIRSKSYKLFPVSDMLKSNAKEHLMKQMESKEMKQPREKADTITGLNTSELLTKNKKDSKL